MAIGFNGSSDVATRSANVPTGIYTLCGWVKVTSVRSSAYQYFAGLDNGGAYELIGYDNGGNLELSWGDSSPGGTNFSSTPTLNTWFFFAIIKSGGGVADTLEARFMEPGGSWVVATSGVGQTVDAPSPSFHFGNDGWDEWSNVHMAHIRVWDSVLTPTELEAEMASATPVKSSPLMVWPLEDNTDNVDDSGNGYNLTFSGTLTTETGPTFDSNPNLDTRSKRASALQLLKPWAVALVAPDNALTQSDQQHNIFAYAGILAQSVIATVQPYILRLAGIPTMGKHDRPSGWN